MSKLTAHGLFRRQVPKAAQRAAIGGPGPFHAGDESGVEGVALGAVAAFAGAHALSFVGCGFFHGPNLAQKETKVTEKSTQCRASVFLVSSCAIDWGWTQALGSKRLWARFFFTSEAGNTWPFMAI